MFKISKFLHVFCAIVLMFSTLPVQAQTAEVLKILGAEPIKSTAAEREKIASVVLGPKATDAATKVMAQSGTGEQKRPIVVDGRLTEMPEWIIKAMIGIGAFIVVYPGTEVPYPNKELGELPNYPPDWAGL